MLRFASADAAEPVALVDGGAVSLGAQFADVLSLIDAGAPGLEVARAELARGEVKSTEGAAWFTPLQPRQLRDFLAFEEHLRNGMRQSMRRRFGRVGAVVLEKVGIARVPAVWYERPLYYKGNRFSVIGHEQDVAWPHYAELMDYELELGIVIGKKGRDIDAADALDHVFGYTVFNDVSARDVQGKEMGPGFHLGPSKSKDFDTGNVLGPCILTADEVPNPYAMTMTARGERRGVVARVHGVDALEDRAVDLLG